MALHWMPARERRRGECEPRRDRELEDANNLFPRRNMSFFTEAWEMHAYACQTIDHERDVQSCMRCTIKSSVKDTWDAGCIRSRQALHTHVHTRTSNIPAGELHPSTHV